MTVSTTFETPCARWRDSYRKLIAEFEQRNEPLIPFPLRLPHHDFDAFVDRMARAARGEDMADGRVPNSTYWLIKDDTEVVAVSNLRHELNERLAFDGGHIGYGVRPSARRSGHATRILAETLSAAAQLGLDRCLVTCLRHNIGSARAIQRNGGVLESEVHSEQYGGPVQRYWIDLTSLPPQSK